MEYFIAAVVLVAFVLFVFSACMAGGRHDRLGFEKEVPINNHGLSPFSAMMPKDEERARKTKELLAEYTYFFWNDAHGFGGGSPVRIVSWEPSEEEIRNLCNKYLIVSVFDFSYADDRTEQTVHNLCLSRVEPDHFGVLVDNNGGFYGMILYPKARALEQYIDRFGAEGDDDRMGYELWYLKTYMGVAVKRFADYYEYEMNHEEE